MIKALVIGCGNMGALYDLHTDAIVTHAKALALDPRFSLSVFDMNKELAQEVASKYQAEQVEEITDAVLEKFDCVSICTPTDTHVPYLKQLFQSGVNMVICEKPVSNKNEELNEIHTLYKASGAKVMVNYLRRFQPAYAELKQSISDILKTERLTNLAIRYQRGFINNCSHAFDITEFLLDSTIELTGIKKHNNVADHFETDPTVSLNATWNNANVNVLGLSNVKFSHFEIDLYFEYHKVCIREAGQTIEVLKAETNERFLQPLKSIEQYTRTQCLKDNMQHVINHAYDILNGKISEDNFLRSVSLNQKMLTYLNN